MLERAVCIHVYRINSKCLSTLNIPKYHTTLLCRGINPGKRDKIIKIQIQGYKSTNFAYGRVQKVKAANSRVQKYRAAFGGVQKVKPANSKAVDGTLSYYYKVQSQKYSIN